MHLTLEADYATRIVEFLAEKNCKVDAKTISERTAIPSRFALKILRKLGCHGIVKSYRGSKGGYVLSRPAKDISLLDVIESVQGTYMLSRCQDSEYKCEISNCKFCKIYSDISEKVRKELNSYDFKTISED